jgi:hypothetical protein
MKKKYLVIIGIVSIIIIYFLVGFIAGDYFKMDGNIASTDSTWVGPSLYIYNATLGE